MKILRTTLSIVVLLIVVLALAVAALFMFADPNQLKPVIEKTVKTQTGYNLSMNGSLSWSFYPELGVKMADLTLTAPNASQPFVKASNIHLALNLRSLLQGQHQLTGDLYIGDTTLMKLHLTGVHAVMQFDQGVLTINPLTADLYRGELSGTVSGSQFSTIPAWKWDMTVTNANIQDLLADVNGKEAKLTLSADGSLRFRGETHGQTGEALMQNVTGSGVYSLKQGKLSAIDINYLLQTADALLNKQTIAPPQNLKETTFDRLTGSVNLQKGVLTSNGIELNAATFTARGDLNLGLQNRDIDLRLNIQSTQALKTQFTIPVLVTGTVVNPNVQLDMASINQMVAKQQLERVKTKVQEKVKDLSGKADAFMKRLMGQ
jgi:AsmA protein